MKKPPESPLGKRVALDADVLEGFMQGFLVPRLDNSAPIAPFHRICWQRVTSKHPKVAIAAPRGHAKSTAITFAYALAGCLFGEFSFPVIFSKTYTIAVEFLRTITMELQDNDLLSSTFGFSKLIKDSENDKIFEFENGYQFRVMAMGMDQPVRGLKWGSRRPDVMLLDDIEDDEEVLNDERREKLLNKLLQAIIPAGSPKTKYRMVGTVLHRSSALETLLKSKVWDTLRFEACDEDCSPESILWPEMYDQTMLLSIKQGYAEQGKLDKFNMEYRNSPTDRTAALFKEADLLPITPADREHLADNPYPRLVGGDFAISVKTRRDYTVFMVAVSGPQNWTYIVDVMRARLDSEGIVTTMFEMEEKHRLLTGNNPLQWFVEDGAIFKALRFSLDSEMMQRNVFLNLTPMNPGTTDKRTRSMPFRARVAARKVKFDHEAPWWPALREELLDFDRGVNDDQVDAGAWLGIGLSQLASAPSENEEDEMQRREDELFARLERRGQRIVDRNHVTGY